MKIRIEKFLVYNFIFLFMFSNLITRIFMLDFNLIFYVVAFLIMINSLRYILKVKNLKWVITIIILFTVSILNPNTSVYFNIISLKDIVLPIAMLIGINSFGKYEKETINFMNILYFPFIFYGVFQEYCFYTRTMERYLPWDNMIIIKTLNSGISSNMFQPGGMLRFWGCMNAFIEYQTTCVFLLALLWLNIKNINNKKLFFTNFILLIIFLLLSLERSPILMFLILIIIWKYKIIIKNNHKLLLYSTVTIFTICIIFMNSGNIKKYPRIGGAYERLINAITLNFDEDFAMKDRKERQWIINKQLVLQPETFLGLGPATISPSAYKNDKYIGPHNNFLGYYIAYGFLGLLTFIILLLKQLLCIIKLKSNYKYFGIGVMVAFSLMGIFNMPFMGKSGMIFFLIIGYLINDKKKYNSH